MPLIFLLIGFDFSIPRTDIVGEPNSNFTKYFHMFILCRNFHLNFTYNNINLPVEKHIIWVFRSYTGWSLEQFHGFSAVPRQFQTQIHLTQIRQTIFYEIQAALLLTLCLCPEHKDNLFQFVH